MTILKWNRMKFVIFCLWSVNYFHRGLTLVLSFSGVKLVVDLPIHSLSISSMEFAASANSSCAGSPDAPYCSMFLWRNNDTADEVSLTVDYSRYNQNDECDIVSLGRTMLDAGRNIKLVLTAVHIWTTQYRKRKTTWWYVQLYVAAVITWRTMVMRLAGCRQEMDRIRGRWVSTSRFWDGRTEQSRSRQRCERCVHRIQRNAKRSWWWR